MTMIRRRLEELDTLNVETIKNYLASTKPQSNQHFYAEDIVSTANRFGLNWLGLFAVIYLLSNGDPFWVGVNDDQYPLEGGTMLRYQAVATAIRNQSKLSDEYTNMRLQFGQRVIDGDRVVRLIDDIYNYAGVEVKEPIPLPTTPIQPPVLKPEPTPPISQPPKQDSWADKLYKIVKVFDSRWVWFGLGFVLPGSVIEIARPLVEILVEFVAELAAKF